MHITPPVGLWHNCETIKDMDHIAKLYCEAARNSIRSFYTEDPYLLRGIEFIIRGFIKSTSKPYFCGAGRTFMAINYNGEAFPCYLLESSTHSYGVIDVDWEHSKYKKIQNGFFCNGKAYHAECRQCWAYEICQACMGISYQISKAISKPPNWFCHFQKAIISTVLAEIACASETPKWNLFLGNLMAFFLKKSGWEAPAHKADVRVIAAANRHLEIAYPHAKAGYTKTIIHPPGKDA
jgi:radical SAM protein with 4Fe4S-binding SPASM domain